MLKKTLSTLLLVVVLSACGAAQTDYQGTVTTDSTLADLQGAPTVILFGGTYCPHCVKSIPEYAELIWEPYHKQANLWVNVIDKKKFDNDVIAQGYNTNLKYNDITGENCNFVPSWVVLNAQGEVSESSCGSSKGIDEMAEVLKSLL
jgi:thiol-disulfide isomerase/thioredoxin